MTTQTAVGSGEMCRLTVYGPSSRIELAVPAHVPVADLLPTFLVHLGQELAGSGLDHGGWVLQRLGEPPVDEDLGTAALGLYDGDIVHLRPRSEQLPPVDFDDLVDGVAAAIADRKDRWRPESTRRFTVGLGVLALVVGLVVAPTVGGGTLVAVVSGTAAMLFAAAATAAARAWDDRDGASLLGLGALPFAAVSGLALSVRDGAVTVVGVLTGPALLAAGAQLAAVAVAVQFGIAALRAVLSAVTTAALLVALAGLLATATGLDGPGTAAVVLPVVLLLSYLVPSIAAKLSRLRIPLLPATAAEFQQGVDPEPGATVVSRAAVADAHVGAQYTALGAVSVGCLVTAATAPGRSAPALVLVTALLLLLHSRELAGARHRGAMLAPAVLSLAALVLVEARDRGAGFRLTVLVVVLLLVPLMAAVARVLPGHRFVPRWGLTGDIAHWLAAAAVIPLALSVAGGYSRARGLWS